MNKLIVNADLGRQRISRHIYGHFAEHLGRCIYEGLWVGEDSAILGTRGLRNDVVWALRTLKMPNLRQPAGCSADTYHWTMADGVVAASTSTARWTAAWAPRPPTPCPAETQIGTASGKDYHPEGAIEEITICVAAGQ